MSEGKQLKDFTFNIWTGYFVKRDTPEPIVQTLHAAITKTLGDPAVRQGLGAHSLLMAEPAPLDSVGKVCAQGIQQFRNIAKAINLQAQ
jgi:tripartite-type tricarboxylate transporter receptor subunit TctC